MVRLLLICLHVFMGIGGVVGGSAAIINPQNPLGASTDVLKNAPFETFLIPGIILFTVIGLGNLFSVWMLAKGSKWSGSLSGAVNGALVIWIVVQCIMLEEVNFLHVLCVTLGLTGFSLSAALMFRNNLFPANLVMRFLRREM